MARRVKVRLTKGMADLLNDRGVQSDLRNRARRVLAAAQAAAPVSSGRYRDSLTMRAYLDRNYRTPRGVQAVGSDVPYALAVEAKHGTLSRSLDAA